MTELQERPTAITGYDTSNVLYRVMDRLLLPAERYYDEAFFEAEKEVWMHVWQHACHETEIPNPGDFTEYKILDQSVMLIRQTDGTVKGFYNACRHRGTALACGTGTYRGGQVVCPFHGWRWNLDGTNSYVYTKQGFRPDTVEQAEVNLPEVAGRSQVGLRVDQLRPGRDPVRGELARRRECARPARLREDAREVVAPDRVRGELEDRAGGVLRGLPRDADPP